MALDEDSALDKELDEEASLLTELTLDTDETTEELELLETDADDGALETTEEATLEETALEELLLEPDEPPPPQAARLNARLAVIKGMSFIGYFSRVIFNSITATNADVGYSSLYYSAQAFSALDTHP